MRNVLSGTKKVSLLASVCFVSLLGASAANATTIYTSYSDTVSLQSGYSGDNKPSITPGLASPATINAPVTKSTPVLLFTVSPNSCLNYYCGSGTEKDNIALTFNFLNSPGGTTIASFTDTAVATFLYNQDTDNLCWGAATGNSGTVVSTTASGTCNAPGSGNNGSYEKVQVTVGTEFFDVYLYNWSDWNETPQIAFQDGGPTTTTGVPEPFTLSLFGAGLAGAGAMRRRRKAR